MNSFAQYINENQDGQLFSRHETILWLTHAFERTLINTFPDAEKFRWDHQYFLNKSIYDLESIERKIDRLLSIDPQPCRFAKSDAARFPQLLTAINDIKASTEGSTQFKRSFSDWFEGRKRAVIVDPYIFSSGNEDPNTYSAGLIELIGESPERIDFYFCPTAYDKNIATNIVNGLNKKTTRHFNFYACSNIHDRVWMTHYSTDETPKKNGWQGRVVGASANGIRIRPTYIIDMPKEDAEDYSTYLSHLKTNGGAGKTAAPHFTAPPTPPI